MGKLRLSFLGGFAVQQNEQPITQFESDKVRALLAYLAEECDQAHTRTALAGLLWPELPEQDARNNLRQALFKLRRTVGQDFFVVTRRAIQLNPQSAVWLDTAVFPTDPLTLYQGPFLAGFFLKDCVAFEEWILIKRESHHRQAMTLFYDMAEQHRLAGELELAAQLAWRQVELDAWREEAYLQLMQILAAQGKRSEAIAQYHRCQQLLLEELGVVPSSALTAFYEQLQTQNRSLPCTILHNLPPQPTPFVGRQAEIMALTAQVTNPDCRLLTILGAGGMGKTRLSLEVGRHCLPHFTDGVFFMPLAALDWQGLLVETAVQILNVPLNGRDDPKKQLLQFLRHKKMLLIFDNFEHLLDGATLLCDIWQAAPAVKLLVTSRERLRLRGEWQFPIMGLSFPEEGVEELDGYDAVKLFVQSARMAQPDFALSLAERPFMVQICQLMAGLPLGIELAAAWVQQYRCAEIVRHIQQSLDFVVSTWRDTPARHTSLRAVFHHSWQLLTGVEQTLLAQLAVFRGSFSLAAAMAVAEIDKSQLGQLQLEQLVDKSLVQEAGDGRYQLHETIRHYALEQLVEETAVSDRYAVFYLAYLQEQGWQLSGAAQKLALAMMGLEMDHIRLAWQRAVAQGWQTAVQVAVAPLALFYEMRSWFREGALLFAEAAERMGEAAVSGSLLARQASFLNKLGQNDLAEKQAYLALDKIRATDNVAEISYLHAVLGMIHSNRSQYLQARQQFEQSWAGYEQLSDDWGKAKVAYSLGKLCNAQGNLVEAAVFLQQGLQWAEQVGDPSSIASLHNMMGMTIAMSGNLPAARTHFAESVAGYRETGYLYGLAYALLNLAQSEFDLGSTPEQVTPSYAESSQIFREIGDRSGEAYCLNCLADLAWNQRDYSTAERHYVQALAQRRELGDQDGIAISLLGMGQVALTQSRLTEAGNYLQESLRLSLAIEALPLVMHALARLARLLVVRGEVETAVALYNFLNHQEKADQEVMGMVAEDMAQLETEKGEGWVTAVLPKGQSHVLSEIADIVFKKVEVLR